MGPPVDEDEERQRLLADVAQHRVDAQAALALAERLAHLQPLPAAYRAVDRHIVMGDTVEEAAAFLLA